MDSGHAGGAPFGMALPECVVVDGESLGLADVVAVARRRAPATLGGAARARVETARALVEEIVARGDVVYGINTGFGSFEKVVIPPARVADLQRNLMRSHACAVGRPLDAEVVRAAMLLRANALARGHSGVRPAIIDRLLQMLERGVHPVVPEQGSLGASGDLAPLAHIMLVLIGEGAAEYKGQELAGGEALRRAGLEPVELQAKEGLALINGTQVMTALGALAAFDAHAYVQSADAVAALTVDVLRGIPAHFDERIQRLRPHPGQAVAAANMRRLLDGSRLTTRPGQIQVQNAYTLRCIPQVHGAVRDALSHVAALVVREANSVNDNPLLFPETGEVLGGGNFHGQPVSMALDYLGIACAALSGMIERRVERLVNRNLSGLPAFLTADGGVQSGLMIGQYTAASLVSENKILASPASVDTIPSSENQEDHVSMGTTAARKCRAILGNCFKVLAIEALCAAQAVDVPPLEQERELLREKGLPPRARENLAPLTRTVYDFVRRRSPRLDEDRSLSGEIERLAADLQAGELCAALGESGLQ
jgi:histidine ammonia-lyase